LKIKKWTHGEVLAPCVAGLKYVPGVVIARGRPGYQKSDAWGSLKWIILSFFDFVL